MSSDASALDEIRKTKEYQAARAQLADREFRLDSLYWIKDEEGLPIPFKRNEAQLYYSKREWYRDTILKARKLGFSTFIAIEILDACIFASNSTAGIVDRTKDEAVDKLSIIKFAYDRMPQSIKNGVSLIVDNQTDLAWSNGSSVAAGTSYRGGTPQMLWVSEFGIISAKTPDVAREIKTGSFKSVPKRGKIWVESTPMGTSGEFFDLVKAGEQLAASGQKLTEYDFRLHFFAWHRKQSNRLPINMVHIPHDMKSYFEELRDKHGIATDGTQQAWYVKQREILGPDDIKSEEPSTADECFFASLEGAYFKSEMNQARRDKRIGLPVPYDSTRPVNTSVDLGLDGNLALIFFQTDGVRHRIIDCARGESSGLPDFIRIVKDKAATRGFIYNSHFGPHDLDTRDFSNMNMVAQTRKEVAAEHGINFTVVPRVSDKGDAIEAGRRFINSCWFCADHTGPLVDALDSYTRGWNKSTMQWMSTPAKNGSDHFADTVQGAAMALRPDVVHRRDMFGGKRKGSHWSA